MASFALTTARMIVAKPSVAASARAASASAVRVPVAAAPMMAHSVRAVSQRGFVGFAAPRVFAPRQQRAAFTMEAAAEDGAAVSGEEGVKLYVGNLSWGVTNDSLADVFNQYGASDVTVVTDMNTGRSRGFGFVTVPDQAVADQCIAALDGADVDGRAIRVNVSVAREDRPPRPDRPPRDGQRRGYDFDGRKVYFGNLSWGMDHLDLQDLCGEFGTVEDARLITDRETNRSRGFGFVTMSTVAEAEEVVNQLNGQDVDGRVLRVNIANVDK